MEMTSVGSIIRQTRMNMDLNIKVFATKVGLSGLELYDIERGKKNPTKEQLSRICRELNLPYVTAKVN